MNQVKHIKRCLKASFAIVVGIAQSTSMNVYAQVPSPSLYPYAETHPSDIDVNSCAGRVSPGNPYPCCTKSGVQVGNCTWWAWARFKEITGESLPSGGNAKDWIKLPRVQSEGAKPIVGSVVIFQPGYKYAGDFGHVAVVEEVKSNGMFVYSQMGCFSGRADKPVTYSQPTLNGRFINFIYPPTVLPFNPKNPSSSSSSHFINQWSSNPIVTMNWPPGIADSSGMLGYKFVWSSDPNTSPDNEIARDVLEGRTELRDGSWYFALRAQDRASKLADSVLRYGPVKIDSHPPANPQVIDNGAIANDVWQRSSADVALSWDSALDGSGSGVANYKYYWGPNSAGQPDTVLNTNSFNPAAACAANGACAYYFRVQTTDNVGLKSAVETRYTLKYDGQPPGGSFQINNGSSEVYQVVVELAVSGTDGATGSGIADLRISNDGVNWSEWRTSTPYTNWQLNALSNVTQTVHMQLRDAAGNIGTLPTQQVRLNLDNPAPNSANYRLWSRVQAGGGNSSSSNYRLQSTTGQSISSATIKSSNFVIGSGFLSAAQAKPVGTIPPGGVVPQPITPTVTPVTPTPTPTPPITQPQSSEYYGLSVNGAAKFTNDSETILNLYAPSDTVEMMVSNDGGFAGAYWEAYSITKTWEIDYYKDYVLPRIVYVRYRDNQGNIHGNFPDDIIYDPNIPTGNAKISSFKNGVVTVSLDINDDLSGVSEVALEVLGSASDVLWESYSSEKAIPVAPGDTVLVHYRDFAGNSSIYPLELLVPPSIYLPTLMR